uniref:FMR1 neighbor protein n=1 Tax=Panthera onca TaxID=9690 RepID=UPI002954A710|nr:FMR1 neighbor protein [Panthera onca]
MPSDRRSLRKRTRSKIGSLKGPHSRVISCDAGCTGETPADESHPGGSVPGREDGATAAPQAGWRASLGAVGASTHGALLKLWAHRCLGLLLLASCALLLGLCYYVSAWSPKLFYKAIEPFYVPTNDVRGSQVHQHLTPNNRRHREGGGSRAGEPRSQVGGDGAAARLPNNIIKPTEPTQMFRMFGLGVIGMIILGCVPIFCCSLWRRSKWANPLGRKVNKIVKGVKKQKKKLKKDAEMLGTAAEDE